MTEVFLDVSLFVFVEYEGIEYEYKYLNLKHAEEQKEFEEAKGNRCRIIVND